MAIPHDYEIQMALLRLLGDAPDGSMHCNDAYEELAKLFPKLTTDDVTVPYGNSISHWANRVQFARLHLVGQGWMLRPYVASDRGVWKISEAGRQWLTDSMRMAEELLKELESWSQSNPEPTTTH